MKIKNKAGIVILASDKIDFKKAAVARDEEGHYIMRKGLIQQEYVALVNLDPHIYIKQC